MDGTEPVVFDTLAPCLLFSPEDEAGLLPPDVVWSEVEALLALFLPELSGRMTSGGRSGFT